MSRQVVGYESGRPVFKDEGPGRARASSGGDSMGGPVDTTFAPAHLVDRTGPRLPVAPVERRAMPRLEGAPLPPSEGSGPIERRIATPEERAAWAASSKAKPRKPTAPHGDPFAASRARGAARAGFVPGGTKLPRGESSLNSLTVPRPPEEVPVLPHPADNPAIAAEVDGAVTEAIRSMPVELTDEPRIDGLVDTDSRSPDLVREFELTRAEVAARLEADAEVENLGEASASAVAELARNIPIPFRPDVVTPCEDCAHAIVCSIRPALEADVAIDLAAVVLPTGTRVSGVVIECDHFLAKVATAPTHRFVGGPAGLVAERLPSDDHGEHRARIDSCAFCADESFAPQDARETVTKPAAPDDATASTAVAGRPGRGGLQRRLPRDQGEREAKVLEAVRGTSTAADAGRLVGVSGSRVLQIVQEMRRMDRLPADIDALMRQRGGGGRTAPVTAQA